MPRSRGSLQIWHKDPSGHWFLTLQSIVHHSTCFKIILFNCVHILRVFVVIAIMIMDDKETDRDEEEVSDFDEDLFDWTSSTLDLAGKKFHELPSKLRPNQAWSHVTELTLCFNWVKEIPDGLFARFTGIKILNLGGNELETLPPDMDKMVQLEELYLGANKLSSLPDSICSLEKLTILKVDDNRLFELPPSIGSLKSLKNLDIKNNMLLSLPESTGNLSNLIELAACNNQLKSLPVNFGDMKCLEVVDFGFNALNILPESFANLPKIKRLVLEKNEIQILPPEFKSSHTLEILDLSSNSSLTSLPRWIGEMPNIIDISFQSCGLLGNPFPEPFGHTSKKLKRLELAGNFMEAFPESMGLIESLEFLDIGSDRYEPERKDHMRNGNNVIFLPTSFGSYFHNMQELRLDENHINELPADFGSGLGLLKVLDLHCNNIRGILPKSFCQMVSLEYLTLSMNGLTELPADIGNMRQLKELILNSNQVCIQRSFRSLIVSMANRSKSCPIASRTWRIYWCWISTTTHSMKCPKWSITWSRIISSSSTFNSLSVQKICSIKYYGPTVRMNAKAPLKDQLTSRVQGPAVRMHC